jgi:lycopene beta-cyclase
VIEVDHLILGAGCSGLSLAVHLGEKAARERGEILVLDARRELVARDRTWCSFGPVKPPFDRCVTHSWSSWRIEAEGRTLVRHTPARPYQRVPSEVFFEFALEHLQGREAITVRSGVDAGEPRVEGSEHVRVSTSLGEVRARMVWDARGGEPRDVGRIGSDIDWLQHFVGWEVQTERPIFEPGVATLMDFEVSQRHGPHFVYVLPFAADRALVEDTYFSPAPLSESEYRAQLETWLERHGAGSWTVTSTERGQIPMSTAEVLSGGSPRVVAIGLRGGAAKPSTGYAFAFIQRQTRALARLAGDGRTPPPALSARPAVASFFDRVFLSYLARHPRSAPAVFGGLFHGADPYALVRFLSEEGTPRDHLAVMRAVPTLGVGLEAIRSAPLWMRR